MAPDPKDVSDEFEKAAARAETGVYLLRLYVTGTTPRSMRAIANIRRICEENLLNRYQLEVIDVYQKPEKAKQDQIVALPTLIKELPFPLRRIVGDLSDTQQVLIGLDLVERDTDPEK